MKPLLDVKGAAQALAVSPWTIRSYVQNGKLRAVRIGRLVRFEEKELQRFISHSSGNREQYDKADRQPQVIDE